MACPTLADSAPRSTPSITTSTSPTSDAETRVLLVDNHPAIRSILSSRLEQEDHMVVVGESGSAGEALPQIAGQLPDVVVVEISLGGVDGLTLTRRINSKALDTGILVFSMYDDSIYSEWAIRAGASGYVMKTEPPDTVIHAIHEIARGRVYLRKSIRAHVLDRLLRDQDRPDRSGVRAMTLREVTVFQMLGDGNSVTQIAKHLNLSRKTIETYRRRAKEKIGCETVDDLLQYAALWTNARR